MEEKGLSILCRLADGNALMSCIWERKDKSFEKIRLGKREIAVITLIFIIIVSVIYYQESFRYPVLERKNVIGIIRIEGYIEEPVVVNRYVNLINEALVNESIKGVVLVVDSGGGYAHYVEEIYLDLLELNKSKPLVASVISALSGGYYITVAADYVFAQDSSLIGSIGAIGFMPPILVPSEQIIESGPYKWTGESKILRYSSLSRVVDNFISAVEKGRAGRLKASSTELKKAKVYLGSEAIKLGLADEVGGLQKAISKVAEKAGLIKYEVEELKMREKGNSSLSEYSDRISARWKNITLETLSKLHPPPSIHYIYLPPQAITQSSIAMEMEERGSPPSSGGNVIVDLSHENKISWWILDILISKLAKKGITVSFISDWSDLESRLNETSCLIVAAPTVPYSLDECRALKEFVDQGGLLLIFFDPAWEFIGAEGLYHELIAPVNSLAINFGFSFGKGYLYNEEEHFGIYRNIYVRNFSSSALTRGLNSIVLFTATYIHSANRGIAWTSNNTYSSVAERSGRYATIVLTEQGQGKIIAFGDLTFLMEPYCYVEDNYKLIDNLVSLIAEGKR